MESGDFIAISAAIIALASLYVSVEQSRLTRLHNKLSVRPYLCIYRKQFLNQPVEYILENHGLGPAIINGFSVLVDDHEVDPENDNPLLCALDLLTLSRDDVGGNLPGKPEPLIAGEAITLLKFRKSPNDPGCYQALMDKLPRLQFKISYQSMYNENFTYIGNGD